MSETVNEKLTFVEGVMKFLKCDDGSKVVRFHKRTVKYLNDQIRLRTDSITEMKEKLVDLNEEYADSILNVDLDRIKTIEATKEYSEEYISNLLGHEGAIESVEKSIENKGKEIEKFQKLISKMGTA